MGLKTAVDWLTWAAVVLPLITLAWSAWRYVHLRTKEAREKEFNNFFLTLERVHNANGSLIAQKAAVFELRNYPRYKDVVLRICDEAPTLFGPSPDPRVQNEFALTAEFFRR
jgi:hypothetical protein